ncbi:MAG TPA: DUF2884 family protein [Thermoanaerobaculia bacterium]|nr:DUF2884 family protein [Thermoanaerobaculia bacterium]
MSFHFRRSLQPTLAAAIPFASAIAFALLLAAAPAAASHISIDLDDGDQLRIDDGDVIITDDDDREARVEPNGTLTVEGRRVRLAERDRQALVLYNQSIRRIEDQAIEVGVEGAGLAAHALTEALVGVATGEPHRAERRVRHHAEDLKDAARRLCNEVRFVQHLQDSIAARVDDFAPFTVIDLDDDDCQVDD